MAASDASFNGRFFTGVHSTGIYCLPGCRARKPKPENVVFYATIDEARAAGLRACLKCRPDEFAQGVDPDLEAMVALVDAVRAQPGQFAGVAAIAKFGAMSERSLVSALRTHYGVTPGALLTTARIDRAAQLLQAGGSSASEVGAEVGYESDSAFYANFGRRMGMPPAQYRALAGAPGFHLELPPDYRSDGLLRMLGRDPESLTEQVDANQFAITGWAGDDSYLLRGEFCGNTLRVIVEGKADRFAVHRQLSRVLGFEQDPKPFEEHVLGLGLGPMIEGREGLRIPQTSTPYDGLIWSIVGQQVNLRFAFALRRRLTEVAGESLTGGMLTPPKADRVASLSIEDLLPHQYSRRKAEYLIEASKAYLAGTLDLNGLLSAPPAVVERTLLAVRGLGPWSANYLMMRAFGLPDSVPVGDTGLTSGLAALFDVPRPGPNETVALMEKFRPYRSLACYHIWRSLG